MRLITDHARVGCSTAVDRYAHRPSTLAPPRGGRASTIAPARGNQQPHRSPAAGYDVTIVDPSAAMLDRARSSDRARRRAARGGRSVTGASGEDAGSPSLGRPAASARRCVTASLMYVDVAGAAELDAGVCASRLRRTAWCPSWHKSARRAAMLDRRTRRVRRTCSRVGGAPDASHRGDSSRVPCPPRSRSGRRGLRHDVLRVDRRRARRVRAGDGAGSGCSTSSADDIRRR